MVQEEEFKVASNDWDMPFAFEHQPKLRVQNKNQTSAKIASTPIQVERQEETKAINDTPTVAKITSQSQIHKDQASVKRSESELKALIE